MNADASADEKREDLRSAQEMRVEREDMKSVLHCLGWPLMNAT